MNASFTGQWAARFIFINLHSQAKIKEMDDRRKSGYDMDRHWECNKRRHLCLIA